MLVSAKDVFEEAREGKHAVGQFNINSPKWIRPVLLTAEELKSPVVLGVSEDAGKHMTGFKTAVVMIQAMMEELNITVPATLYLDHGIYDGCYKCVKAGFSSVMLDGLHYPIEENIEKTKELAKVAHAMGLPLGVEAGSIGGEEDSVVGLGECADPRECKAIADLGIDFLVAGIGNTHDKYPENWPGLRFDVLEQVKTVVGDVPLVLHGSTDILEDVIKKAIGLDVMKISVNTGCQLFFAAATREYIGAGKDPKGEGLDPRKPLAPGADAIRVTIKEEMELFGSAGEV